MIDELRDAVEKGHVKMAPGNRFVGKNQPAKGPENETKVSQLAGQVAAKQNQKLAQQRGFLNGDQVAEINGK
jgi:hypothetical protein